MSKNRHPIGAAEFARIPADAASLVWFLQRKATTDRRGIRVLIATRESLAAELGITVRQLGRAESHLLAQHAIRSELLPPRDPSGPRLYLWRFA